MSGYVLKSADRPVTYSIDWRRGYLAPGERVLRDLGWTVQPVPLAGSQLRVITQMHDGACSWAEFAGGDPGRVYMIASRVRTSDDRVLSRAIVMRIALGAGPQ